MEPSPVSSARLPLTLLLLQMLAAGLAAPVAALPDGELDTGFGGGDGLVTSTEFGQIELADIAAGENLLIGVGKFAFGGGGPHLHWWSVGLNGLNDANHLCDGTSAATFPLSFATSSRANVAIVDSAGRLVVGGALAMIGSESQDRPLLARFDLSQNGCVLDDSFTSDGWELFDGESWCAAADCEVLGLVEITPATGAVTTPRLVALVRATSGGFGASRLFLLRLTAAGSPDTAFGGDGWVEITHAAMGTLFSEADLAIDARGRLYVLVTHSDPDEALDLDVSLLRYGAGGTIDAGFGTAGRLSVSGGGAVDAIDAHAHQLAVAPDGALFASITEVGGASPVSIYTRRPSDGSLAYLSFGTDTAPVLAYQGDGKLVYAWDRDSIVADNFRGQRYRFDPAHWLQADTTFGNGASFVDYDVDLSGSNAEEVTAIALWHGRVVYGGTASAVGSTAAFMIRTNNSFVFADGFEGGTVALWSTAAP